MFILFGMVVGSTNAQFTLFGQDPANIRWKQIHTANFQIVFPEDFESEAQKLSHILENVYVFASKTLNHKPNKISILLHNQTSISNAFVTYAPWRSEFNIQPPQDIYPQDWLEQLAIHEFRHVVQLDKMRQGLTEVLYYIFGEYGVGAVLGLVPIWFLEGDAVIAETVLSNSGRGRLPSFEMPLRTQVLEEGIYHYEKAFFGSYKDFVPDYYILGYHLTAYGRWKYDASIWNNALNSAARRPYIFTPFSKGIKKSSGLDKWKFYNKTLRDLRTLWGLQADSLIYSHYGSKYLQSKKVFTNYRFPQFINDSVLICEKSGLGNIQEFVMLYPDGKEEHLFTPGFYFPIRLNYNAGKIVWSELVNDARWQNRVWQDIFLLDVQTRKKRRISHKQYYAAPALSPSGNKILAVETTPENEYFLVVLNVSDGSLINKFKHPANAFFITPLWFNESTVLTILLDRQGKHFSLLDMDSGNFTPVTNPSFEEISLPFVKDSTVYFHAAYSGIDNIYSLNLTSKEINQVSSARYGATDVAINPSGNKMVYSNYTSMGYDIADIVLTDERTWNEPLDSITNNSIRLADKIKFQEPGVIDFEISGSEDYEVEKYSKWKNLINIHSWGPIALDEPSGRINTGFNLVSQNLLSTSVLDLGYRYDLSEQAGGVFGGISYRGWYPYLNLRGGFTNRNIVQADTLGNQINAGWQENQISSSVSLPLSINRGAYFYGLVSTVGARFLNIEHTAHTPENFMTGSLFNLQYQASLYRIRKRAIRDLRPRWGQQILFNYRHTPAGSFFFGPSFTSNIVLLNPGLFKHHSLRLSFSAVRNASGDYIFEYVVPFTRGYLSQFQSMFYLASLDYALPIVYPDFRIGPLLYIQRVNGNIFSDIGKGYGQTGHTDYLSTGIEVTADVHLLNFIFPNNIGFRYSYVPMQREYFFQILFNIGI